MISTPLIFDPELLRRYDQPGPRYTSYPTAPQFSDRFGEEMLRTEAAKTMGSERELSLYLHIPFCSSPCFYCGCNRVITRDQSRGDAYVVRLHREIEMMASLFSPQRGVIQLHFGGGSPNFLTPRQLADTVEVAHRHFSFSRREDRDFSIEIDPRFIDADGIHTLAEAGFNRVSFGVQDFDPEVQQAVNRIQGVKETLDVIEACRRHGLRLINVDLIYGLPKQNLEGFSRTLDIVLEARPERLAVYSYAHLPHLFRPQTQINADDLPTPEVKLGLLQCAIDKLGEAGYIYIGMDHFALPKDDLAKAQARGGLHRNFMGYTTHADSDLVGLGVSAISHIGPSFSQNPRDLPSWEQAIDNGRLPVWRGMTLNEDDLIRADLIQQLMCHGEIDFDQIAQRHAIDFHEYFADSLEKIKPLVADGLVEAAPRRITATARGRLLLRIVAMCFDRYLQNRPTPVTDKPQFSRTI
ncbi:MAG: oxygen-independent coproporphyrinogen III oxidase [Xanthomonadaceae bacterium]|jgi:oxygen-independent coproporphyrinogen-3 oxidase|nr:oxygen-independent coproporphyrinogen III oxidase [Xanthomonadaceae bacterium]